MSAPLRIDSFREFVKSVAHIAFHNPDYSLFFRGQDEDYRNSGNLTTVFPSIYRGTKPSSDRDPSVEKRFETLGNAESLLLKRMTVAGLEGVSKLRKYRELRWAVLQHYQICSTPLIDMTHSLRVAASFALFGERAKGVVLVFGFPHPAGSITYSVDEELLLVKLLTICPPKALRPYFQEGFLAGSFPTSERCNSAGHEFGKRLIAKFDINGKHFWDGQFQAIPKGALFPREDKMAEVASRVRNELK